MVGQAVADRLAYRLVDEEILQQAAESVGVSVEELTDVEHRTKVIDGLLRSLAVSAGGAAGVMSVGADGPIDVGGVDPIRSPCGP